MQHKTFYARKTQLKEQSINGKTFLSHEIIPVPPLAEQVATFCNENNITQFTVVQLGADVVGIVY